MYCGRRQSSYKNTSSRTRNRSRSRSSSRSRSRRHRPEKKRHPRRDSPKRKRKSRRHHSSSSSSSEFTPEASSLGNLVGIPAPVPPPINCYVEPQPPPPGVQEMPSVASPPVPPPPLPPGYPTISQHSTLPAFSPLTLTPKVSFKIQTPLALPIPSMAGGIYNSLTAQAFPFSVPVPPLPSVPPPPPPEVSSTSYTSPRHLSTSLLHTPSVKINPALSLPMPNTPASINSHSNGIVSGNGTLLASSSMSPIYKRSYDRPLVLNKRKLPEVSENWGIGSLSNYKITAQVGEGTYGQVYKAVERNSKKDVVALKKVRLENEREGFPITAIREIKILRQLEHKNVVRLFDIVTDQKTSDKLPKTNSGAFYLVFEYVDHDLNGLLDSNMVEFSDLQIASLVKQLLLALEHCHNLNFLHRDIKCANILINNRGELKLGDFGLARLYLKDIERLYTNRVITLWYRPPELLLGQERYGTEVDIWSAGCILGELFVKRPIFQGNTEQTQLEIISQYCGTPTTENWPGVVNLPNYKMMRMKNFYTRRLRDKFAFLPAQALDLLDKLLQLDPTRRPSAPEILNHPWLVNVNPDQVPPPALPKNQDCHEMWSKKMRSNRGKQQGSSSSMNNNYNATNTSSSNNSNGSFIGRVTNSSSSHQN